jgi:hypothetical protein
MGTDYKVKQVDLDGNYEEYCAYLRSAGASKEEIEIMTKDIGVLHIHYIEK